MSVPETPKPSLYATTVPWPSLNFIVTSSLCSSSFQPAVTIILLYGPSPKSVIKSLLFKVASKPPFHQCKVSKKLNTLRSFKVFNSILLYSVSLVSENFILILKSSTFPIILSLKA